MKAGIWAGNLASLFGMGGLAVFLRKPLSSFRQNLLGFRLVLLVNIIASTIGKMKRKQWIVLTAGKRSFVNF